MWSVIRITKKNVGLRPDFPSQVYIVNTIEAVQIDCCTYLLGRDPIFYSHDCPERCKENEHVTAVGLLTHVGLPSESGPQTWLYSKSPNHCFHFDEPQIFWHSNLSTAY